MCDVPLSLNVCMDIQMKEVNIYDWSVSSLFACTAMANSHGPGFAEAQPKILCTFELVTVIPSTYSTNPAFQTPTPL